MNQLIQNFLTYLRIEKNCSENTIKAYGYRLSLFERAYPHLAKVQTADIRTWLANRQNSPATRKALIITLKSFYSFLAREGIIEKSPAKALSFPQIRERTPVYLSLEELQKWKEEANPYTLRGLRERAVISLMADTGLRLSEAISLNVEDLSLAKYSIITRKTKGEVFERDELPFSQDGTTTDLQRYLAAVESIERKDRALFISREGKRISTITTCKRLAQLAKEANLGKKVTSHTLRHTFAVHLLWDKTPDSVIQRLLRHKDPRSTAIYTRLLSKDDKDIHRDFLKRRSQKIQRGRN